MLKRWTMFALCSLFLSPALPAAATDYTDIWYIPAESGWGVNLVQAENVIFATFFVYGPNNQPTWFVAITNKDGNGNFSGSLYTTVGPYYGGPWNPAIYMPTLAGTATFVPKSPYAGTLTYSIINGPTEVKSIQHLDSNGDGRADYSLITVISQQGNAGAHDEDLLGTIKVYGNLVKASDISVDAMSVYGAYEKVGQLPAGVHYQIEDDGVLPNGASDGGHHNEAAMAMNLAIANHM